MSLHEILDSVGITKTELAKLMGVSRQTIARLGDNTNDAVLEAIELYKQSAPESIPVPMPKEETPVVIAKTKHKPGNQCTRAELVAIWTRRRTETDYEIAASMGLSVFHWRHQFLPSYQVVGIANGYSK